MSVTGETIRVLHVDDDPEFADAAGELLSREESEIVVETVESAAAGLEVLADGDVDCVVSDYDMPGMDGLEFLAAVREERPDLPFVLFTAQGDESIASEAISAGVTDYFEKTGDAEQYAVLANRVADAVAAHRTRRRADRHEQINTLLRSINRRIVEAESVRDVEQTVCEALANSESYRFAWVGEAADSGEVVPRTSAGDAEDYLAAVTIRHDDTPEGRGPAGRTVRTRETHVVENIATDPEFERWRESAERYGFASVVVLPLEHGDGFHGVLAIYADSADAFDDTERAVLEELADAVGAAIGAAETRRRLRRREEALEALHRVGFDLDACDTVDAVCERTVEASERILAFDRSLVAVEEDGVLHVRAASEQVPEAEPTSMPVSEGVAGETYRTGEPIVVDDLRERLEREPELPYRSLLSLPVGGHGNFQAVAEEPAAFDDADRELAELLVNRAASALDRLAHDQELERRNERLSEFADIVSHDIRNPLNVATARLALAQEECDSDHLEHVESAHDRIDALIEDLLTLARQGTGAPDLETVALADLVERCWDNVHTSEASLAVETDCTLRADRGRLSQLVENLVRNAVDHGGDAVAVTVGDLEDGFYVADDGPGISEAERERVFESGYSTAGGTGFGLNIVEQVVADHGWEIRVTESESGGARFEVTGVDG